MRRSKLAPAALILLLPAGSALASAPPTEPGDDTATTVAEEMSTDTADTATVDSAPTGPEIATIFNDDDEAIATVEATAVEANWTDYGDDDAPDEGDTYVRVAVNVSSSIPEDTFAVSVEDFILQDQYGDVHTASNVLTAAEVDAGDEVPGDAELANGESAEFHLTFSVPADAEAQWVFYRPDDEHLVNIIDVTA